MNARNDNSDLRPGAAPTSEISMAQPTATAPGAANLSNPAAPAEAPRPWIVRLADFIVRRPGFSPNERAQIRWLLIPDARSREEALAKAEAHLEEDEEALLSPHLQKKHLRDRKPRAVDARRWRPPAWPYKDNDR